MTKSIKALQVGKEVGEMLELELPKLELPEIKLEVAKCENFIRPLSKVLERLDEAEALYGVDRVYGALAKIGAAYTSLALAYSKGVITKDEWKELSPYLFRARQSILEKRDLKDVLEALDKARDRIERVMFEKFTRCLK